MPRFWLLAFFPGREKEDTEWEKKKKKGGPLWSVEVFMG